MPKKILIVEDDQETSGLMKVVLQRKGFAASTAASKKEALELFEKESFDLIILDILLPKEDGFATAEIIRKKESEIPIIAVTACERHHPEFRHNDPFSELSMTYIRKPFDVKRLIETITMRIHARSILPDV